jgi:chorismate mutase
MSTTTQDLIRDAVITALDDALNAKNNFKPEFLAEKFSDMNAENQAAFFNALANIVDNWKAVPVQQWIWMSNYLTIKGRRLLGDMQNHTETKEQAHADAR